MLSPDPVFLEVLSQCGGTSQNAGGPVYRRAEVKGSRVGIPSRSTLHTGADYKNTDLAQDFTAVDVS